MRVTMVDPSLFTGRYDDGLCTALADQEHEVTLLGRPLRPTDAIKPANYRYRPRFFRLGEALRDRLGEGMASQLAKAATYMVDATLGSLDAFGRDIVHFQWLPFARADAFWLHRLAGHATLIHTVHNATPFHGSVTAQGRGYHALLKRFDALIVHGDQTRDALIRVGLDGSRIHVVPHPPMALAEATPADLAAIPEPARDIPRVLFFGTIRPYKGLDLLVEAAIGLWREGLAFELAIAGKPFSDITPLTEAVRSAGFEHRLVTDLAFLSEGRLDAHLRRADIIAFPYRAIDSSGAFLSALRYGAAMITSDAGMFGELKASGVTRFPVGNVESLAKGLRPLIESKAQRGAAGKQALELLATLPGWDAAARMTADVYRKARATGARA